MNEIQLSDSLPIIETEIRQYQNLAGESIFEIGRRLKHVKENDLVHGEFGKWLESINLDRTQAHRFIKVSEEIKDVGTYQHLGLRALSEIATLPESERTKEHVTEKGETKTPDEMTVRELRELKKRLKNQSETIDETTLQLKSREKENEILQSKLEEMENRDPERIEIEKEITKEVFPEDYESNKKMLADLKNKVKRETQSAEKLREELKKYTEAFTDPSEAYEESQVKRLERESSINAYKLSISIQKFIEENAVETYKVSSVIKSDDAAKKRLTENIELLENFTTNMRALLNGRIISN